MKPMTPQQHAQQKAWVIASELLAPTRAQRHGVYPNRKAVPALPVIAAVQTTPSHVYVLPSVHENRRLL